MSKYPERYLGDGVYASCDGYHIILDLRKQGSDRIALEPAVLDQLFSYRMALIDKSLKDLKENA